MQLLDDRRATKGCMNPIGFQRYRDRWVLCSTERVIGEGRIDAPPIRVLAWSDKSGLIEALKELISEPQPVVPEPDWNHPRFKVGIRAEAVGLKSWRAFVKDARSFHLEGGEGGTLLLEEWPRQGGSFSANRAWQRTFTAGAFEDVVEHLMSVTHEMPRSETKP